MLLGSRLSMPLVNCVVHVSVEFVSIFYGLYILLHILWQVYSVSYSVARGCSACALRLTQ